MTGIALENCEVGTVSSMKDGSVKFAVYTAELTATERGTVMDYHGKACAVVIRPHDDATPDMVTVKRDMARKTPGQRLHAVLFLLWKGEQSPGLFEHYYEKKMEALIDSVKMQLD